MKTIRTLLLALVICLSASINCNAQWGWLAEQVIGAVLDDFAGELGAAEANAAIEKGIKSHSRDVKSSLSGYNKKLNSLYLDSRKNAFGALSSNGIQGDESAYRTDLNMVYKGLISMPVVSDSLMMAFSRNMRNVAGETNARYNSTAITVEQLLGKELYSGWSNRSTEAENRLRRDIYNDLDLIAFFRNVPEALNVYSMIIGSDMRLSRELLIHATGGIGKMSSPWKAIWADYTWGDGKDLSYRTSSTGNSIEVLRGGNAVASIEKKNGKGFTVNCLTDSHDMLNLFPFANSTYTCGDCTWETDGEGRVISATVTLNYPSFKVKRDAIKGTELSYLKDYYSTMGYATNMNSVISDQEMYLIPVGMGGGADLINAVPVYVEILKNVELKALNKDAAKYSKKGFAVTRRTSVAYGNSNSMKPEEITITQSISGLDTKKVIIKNK